MTHANDGAKPGVRLTSCGTCLFEFPAATAQASADACRAHVEAGCPKARVRIFDTPAFQAICDEVAEEQAATDEQSGLW